MTAAPNGGGQAVKIDTERFGTLEVAKSDWIEIKGSILGFERCRRFVLLLHDENTPLCWLQSLEDPNLAFVVINPLVIKPDYQPLLQKIDLEFLGIKDLCEMVLLAIVTVRSNPFRITANLRAPLVINGTSRQANQIILEDTEYPIQYDVAAQKSYAEVDFSGRHGEIGGLGRLAFNATAL